MASVISLTAIVKNILLKRRYPWHYFLEFLVYSKDGLREIAMDVDIICGRYKCLPLNSNHAIEIPNDYLDYTRVSVRIGQYVRPLFEDNNLQLVPNYDDEFEIQPYSEGVAQPDQSDSGYYSLDGYYSPYWWTVNWNNWGENVGRMFGGVGTYLDTFRVNKARNEIKINEALCVDEVVLEYVSNGMDADSATHIDGYAQAAIEAYAMWQFKEHNRTYSAGEAQVANQEFIKQLQILKARLSDLTIDNLRRIVVKNRRGTKS
jgi:hypothetical protein